MYIITIPLLLSRWLTFQYTDYMMSTEREHFGRVKVSKDPIINLQFKLRYNMTTNPKRDQRKLDKLITERKEVVN